MLPPSLLLLMKLSTTTAAAFVSVLSLALAGTVLTPSQANAQYYGGAYGYNNSAPNSYGGDFSGRTYYPRLDTNGTNGWSEKNKAISPVSNGGVSH